MYTDNIKKILLKNLSLERVYVMVNENHYRIIAIDKIFIDKSTLEQHKLIYAALAKFITCNKIHAISIHTFSPKEWNKQRQLFKI